MTLATCFVDIRRDPHAEEVLARGGDSEAHSVLQRAGAGFIAVVRVPDTRNALTDRHAPHPGRSTCSAEVPATERERSAVCACPPSPCTLPAPPPPVAAGLRR
ncbi:hypothetical protein [Streptomyces sp. NPDC026589]|uniref:hypothetical protein n=1 Tax=Streptomyces sp. NPDC026589 TaxID=3155609 RepID=UPI0033F13BB2